MFFDHVVIHTYKPYLHAFSGVLPSAVHKTRMFWFEM